MITLRQLEAFHAVAEGSSFGAAARQLGTTQPAISKRIAEMEAALGVALFDRTNRSVRLTLPGQLLLPHCREMLMLRERMMRAFLDPASFAGIVRVGVTELIALTFLPAWVTAVRRAFPELRLRPEVGLTDDLLRALRRGTLDLAMVPGSMPAGADWDGRSLGRVELAWMRRPRPGGIAGPIPAAELSAQVVLAQSESSALQATANDWLAANGAMPEVLLSSNSLSALSGLAAAGLGTALLPRARFAAEVEAGRLEIVETDPAIPPLEYHASFRRGGLHRITAAMADLAVMTANFEACAAG
jgi:DNA-binding transcriptional LysR family regulator